jgi:hypothetical protein
VPAAEAEALLVSPPKKAMTQATAHLAVIRGWRVEVEDWVVVVVVVAAA